MANISKLLDEYRKEQLGSEKLDKKDIVIAVKSYPKDTPKSYEDIGFEGFMDPLF